MTVPQIVPASEWLAARKELLAAEAQAASALEAATARRRELPAVLVEKDYVFEGVGGQASLLDLFEGRRQLIIQHFMFDPAWDQGCPYCSYAADSVGHLAHLHACDTTFAAVSRAPIGKIEAFRRRMGWSFPWYSSLGSDFNYDFHVTHDEDVTPVEYDFKTKEELIEAGQEWSIRPGEKGGLSVFLRDGNAVLHTYSDYGAMIGLSCGTDLYLALTPFGRQDATLAAPRQVRRGQGLAPRAPEAVVTAPEGRWPGGSHDLHQPLGTSTALSLGTSDPPFEPSLGPLGITGPGTEESSRRHTRYPSLSIRNLLAMLANETATCYHVL